MRRLVATVCALLSMAGAHAQHATLDETVHGIIEGQMMVLRHYKDTLNALRQQCAHLDSVKAQLMERKFPRVVSQQELEQALHALTLADIFGNAGHVQPLIRAASQCELGHTYGCLLDAYRSLDRVYDKDCNTHFRKLLKSLKPLAGHQKEWEEMFEVINSYRFVTFELVRVLHLIDGMEGSALVVRQALELKDELMFITPQYPYACRCLDSYLNSRGSMDGAAQRAAWLDELKQACPEAFDNLK